jgi:hypothetical protein
MILRAAFWIVLVSLFMPHEPDLGFGRPGASAASLVPSTQSIGSLIETTSAASDTCATHKDACEGGLSIIDGFQKFAIRSMDQVRADLDANRTKLR